MDDRLLVAWVRACRARAFELETAKAHAAGKLAPAPIYLSIGTEHVAALASAHFQDWHIFAQHRCHSWYLSYGGCPKLLIYELLGRDGCAGGMGGSASLQWPPGPLGVNRLDCNQPGRMWGHSGLLGDQIPIAAGLALATGKNTLVVLGDAAAEEDYVLATLGFAASKKLPILFLVEDNNLSILTKKDVRRSWSIVEVARGFGLAAWEINGDAASVAQKLSTIDTLPALININVHRHLWHAGSGSDGPPPCDHLRVFRDTCTNLYGDGIVDRARVAADAEMADLWAQVGAPS